MKIQRGSIYLIASVSLVALFFWLLNIITFYFIHLHPANFAPTFLFFLIPSFISSISIVLFLSAVNPMVSDFLVTLRRFLRLDNLANPLLLKMTLIAPGTYHHSINVANLAQKAAKSIGADSLLVRVAAYYHDIGKMDNPEFFVENQGGKENIASDVSPIKAAKIIISHVREGVKLAKSNHLTDEICDLISEHHGTTMVNYFFEVAKNHDGSSLREDYRYDGPIPSSKESAILMLSDSVEAAIRSFSKIDSDTIEKTTKEVINNKVTEQQLINSGLEENEINKIVISLIDTLKVIYHRRIL